MLRLKLKDQGSRLIRTLGGRDTQISDRMAYVFPDTRRQRRGGCRGERGEQFICSRGGVGEDSKEMARVLESKGEEREERERRTDGQTDGRQARRSVNRARSPVFAPGDGVSTAVVDRSCRPLPWTALGLRSRSTWRYTVDVNLASNRTGPYYTPPWGSSLPCATRPPRLCSVV